MIELLPVSLVGSYPLIFEIPKSIENQLTLINGFRRDTMRDYLVTNAVVDQLEVIRQTNDINAPVIISTGQPDLSINRSMVLPYLELFNGVEITPIRETTIISISKEYGQDSTLSLKRGYEDSGLVNDIQIASKILDFYKARYQVKAMLKFVVTGPNTLFWGGIQQFPGEDDNARNFIKSLMDGLVKVIDYVLSDPELKKNIHHIQIDEPIFSNPIFERVPARGQDLVGQSVKQITSKHKIKVFLHICGDMKYEQLFLFSNLGLYALDLELANMLGQGRSFLYWPQYLDKLADFVRMHSVKLSIGVINSRHHRVEEVSELKDFITMLIDKIGYENIIVSPDCGLRNFTPYVARAKLRNLIIAAKEVREAAEVKARATYVQIQEEVKTATLFCKSRHSVFHGILMGSQYRNQTEKVQEVGRKYLGLIHGPSGFEEFSLHGEIHTLNVLHYLNQFIKLLDLDPTDLRLLFVCAYVHDLGMLKINEPSLPYFERRKRHGELVFKFLREHGSEFRLTQEEIEKVGLVCSRHPKRYHLTDLFKPVKFLAALLKIADECDCSDSRIPPLGQLNEVKRKMLSEDPEATETWQMYQELLRIEAVYVNHVENEIQVILKEGFGEKDEYAVRACSRIHNQLLDEVSVILAENGLYFDHVRLVKKSDT